MTRTRGLVARQASMSGWAAGEGSARAGEGSRGASAVAVGERN
jgi:hypothetical protein